MSSFSRNDNIDYKKKADATTRILYPAIVTDIEDKTNSLMIRASIKELRDESLSEVPWSYPFMNKQFVMMPKVGEGVWIMLADPSKPFSDRFWISRAFSNFGNLPFESATTAFINTPHTKLKSYKTLEKTPDGQDLYPQLKNLDKSYWLGRENTDIYQGNGLIELRFGKHERNETLKRNLINPSYIRLEFDSSNKTSNLQVADKIMLVSYQNQTKPSPDMDEKVLDELFEKLSPMAKGDVLVDILKIFRSAILNHSHKYHTLPADPLSESIVKLRFENLDRVLSQNIRIN